MVLRNPWDPPFRDLQTEAMTFENLPCDELRNVLASLLAVSCHNLASAAPR